VARPAIVIGLGGTGQQIVTYLKKELLEIGGGQLPEEVKLLAFDTASRVDPQGVADPEKVFRLGNVALEENTEYVCIGDDLYDTAQRIMVDQKKAEAGGPTDLSYLHWFPARELIERGLSRTAFNTTQGAGAYRTLGRLSLFHHAYTVLGHLQQAMTRLVGEVRGSRSQAMQGQQNTRLLEIIVVCSLAGGTGAGTFIDMAWLTRAQADTILRDKYALRGFFLLPTTFTVGVIGASTDASGKQGRGFAAWHELDRAMLSGGSGNVIVYNPADPTLHITCDIPAYDITYLIDPQRPRLPIQPPPEEGIFPAVAQLISFILDEEAGRVYTENLINHLVNTRGQLPKGVYHSTIGGYTLKVPVYYTQAQFSHKLALQTLDLLLAPEINERGRVIRLSQLANNEVSQGVSGLQSVVSFLTGDLLKSGDRTIPNTKLLQVVGNCRAEKWQVEGQRILQDAQGGLATSLLRYFNALNQVTEYDVESNKVIPHELTTELQWTIWKECPTSRGAGDMPAGAWTRLTSPAYQKSVPSVRQRRFGIESVTTSGPQMRGEFGAELEKPKAAQLKRFKELLQAQTLHDLNGSDSNSLVARGGKLGYVRAFYQELNDTLAYFSKYLEDVRTKRSQDLKLAQTTRNQADHAKKIYEREKDHSCWLTFWDGNVHPDAHRAQRNWLRAEQVDIDRRRGDILLDVLDETANSMKVYVDKTLAEIDSWIAHLAKGDPTFEIEGLYGKVAESLEGIEINHALDKRLGNEDFQTQKTLAKVSQIITEHPFATDGTMLADAISKIRWEVGMGTDGLQLNCGIEFPGETPAAPPVFETFRRDVDKPARHNLNVLIRLTEMPYQGIQQNQPIAEEITGVYSTGRELAGSLHDHAEPFYRYRNGKVEAKAKQAFLRVNYENNAAAQSYFEIGFLPQYLAANPILGGALFIVASADRYKLTLVRSDDLMPSDSFDQWHTCLQPYQGLFANLTPREIHIFTQEQNAAYFERAMPIRLRQNYRILRPEVVALLENRPNFEMFFKAFALGLIAKKTGKNTDGLKQRFWGYQLPQHTEPLYLTSPVIDGSTPSIFEVIRFYLTGRDQRPGYSQAFRIKWDELRTAIAKKEQELGQEKAVKAYQSQMKDSSKGIVQTILSEADAAKALPDHMAHVDVAAVTLQKYTDLADVAQVVYLESIERIAGIW